MYLRLEIQLRNLLGMTVEICEDPEYTCDLRYESERHVCDYERCPGFFRVLLMRLNGNFYVYCHHYDMMRQLSIAQKQYDDVRL